MYVILKLEDAKMLAELASESLSNPKIDKVLACQGFNLGHYDPEFQSLVTTTESFNNNLRSALAFAHNLDKPVPFASKAQIDALQERYDLVVTPTRQRAAYENLFSAIQEAIKSVDFLPRAEAMCIIKTRVDDTVKAWQNAMHITSSCFGLALEADVIFRTTGGVDIVPSLDLLDLKHGTSRLRFFEGSPVTMHNRKPLTTTEVEEWMRRLS